jgi:N-acetylmuramoyl-L-alanine amidase
LAIWHPSPNFGPRLGGIDPHLIVLHYTGMATAQAALERLCDPEHRVSSHYLIDGAGKTYQLVEEDMRAWHAGAGAWGGCHDVNSASVGIELDNPGPLARYPDFSQVQMTALVGLIHEIQSRWNIGPSGVIGHSDMAPGRKFDPGPSFDWQMLASHDCASPFVADGLASQNFWQDLAQIGYAMPADMGETQARELLLSTFRLRIGSDGVGSPTMAERSAAASLVGSLDVEATRA